MKCGSFRVYCHIGSLGFKFPRLRISYCKNPVCTFMTGFISNILEYQRFRNATPQEKLYLGKVFWSCGFISFVKHYNKDVAFETIDVDTIQHMIETIKFTSDANSEENWKLDNENKIKLIDYGDFSTSSNDPWFVTIKK